MRIRFTEEQIIAVLKDAGAGTKTGDICRQHGISDATFYKWKAKYSGIEEWRIEYNTFRPHSSLDYKTPEEFLRQCEQEDLKQNAPKLHEQVV